MDVEAARSRPAAAAARLGDLAQDRHRFWKKRVLLTGEADTLETGNGAVCLDASLRLLTRLCPNVVVALPPECASLREASRAVADRIWFGQPVEFDDAAEPAVGFDAILNIGSRVRPALPWTAINSNGWLARVSSVRTGLSSQCRQTNPIGALLAASLGAAEVFKRLISLKPERGDLWDGLTFSSWTYECGGEDPGAALPQRLDLEALLVGAGAIGNGILYLLSSLPLGGQLWVVDRDDFKDENLGTCLLIGPHDLQAAKATFAQAYLVKRLSVVGYPEKLSTFKNRLDTEIPYPRIVLGAVDSIPSRHELQDLWPDIIIDGAIGDFSCQVSRHPWGEDLACLRCLFREPSGPSAELVQTRATGLPVEVLRGGEAVLTEDHVQAAREDKRDFLRARLGQRICAVAAEGVAHQLSREQQDPTFQPSLPFVACASSAMLVGEVVKRCAGWTTRLDGRFQFDLLVGPQAGKQFPQSRRADCVCVTRAANIAKVQARRRQARPVSGS